MAWAPRWSSLRSCVASCNVATCEFGETAHRHMLMTMTMVVVVVLLLLLLVVATKLPPRTVTLELKQRRHHRLASHALLGAVAVAVAVLVLVLAQVPVLEVMHHLARFAEWIMCRHHLACSQPHCRQRHLPSGDDCPHQSSSA